MGDRRTGGGRSEQDLSWTRLGTIPDTPFRDCAYPLAIEVTVGIDIGTTSVKAIAADGDGNAVERARVPHGLLCRRPNELAHDAAEAWCDGVRAALAEVARDGHDIKGIQVAAMVPSLCAVGDDGRPISDGMLYGDARGAGGDPTKNPSESGELVRFLAWLVQEHPEAAGYWPAQGVANHALCGLGAIDTVTAMTTLPLFDFTGWDADVAADAGLTDVSRLPTIHPGTDPIGKVAAAGDALLGPGTIDAYGEQLVAGIEDVGDVLVILGSTLIVWAVTDDWVELPGVWTVPHTVPGRVLLGGPSNAGGLFVNWARKLVGGAEAEGSLMHAADPGRVPVWQPYLRGERVPFHDPDRRASLHDLDIGMTPGAAMRGVYEASGFAVRHILDLAGIECGRIIATGGGVQDPNWLAALADTTGLPVDRVAVPEGGALGAAYLARVTAGLEASSADAGRWAKISQRVEPNPTWETAVGERYERYRSLAG